MNEIGLVVIGRNEGDRLIRCLRSITLDQNNIVYVDSGSNDGSIERVKELGVKTLELDCSSPFTAARGRNEGFTFLLEKYPGLQFIQFVDGDCEVSPTWIMTAYNSLCSQPDIAIVCGRRREMFPEQSIYNRLCDIEWDTPTGETSACGGDFMVRALDFQLVGGFYSTLIAGEEPELCFRLRAHGKKILRLDAEMTQHDARITSFGQWWNRSVRTGYAFAEGAFLHWDSPERYCVKQCFSVFLWVVLFPILVLSLTFVGSKFWMLLFFVYLLLIYRIYSAMRVNNHSISSSFFYALFCLLGKLPNFIGFILFARNLLNKRTASIIEYK